MWKKIFLSCLLIISLPLLFSCDSSSGKKKKKKKKNKGAKQRGMFLSEDMNSIKARIAPKTPDEALKGFFRSFKTYQHSQAYAYLSSASQKAMSKGDFTGKLGYESDYGFLVNQCIKVEIVKRDIQGNQATVDCVVTLPDQYLIARELDQLQHNWNASHQVLMSDKELDLKVMGTLGRGRKLFTLPSSFKNGLKYQRIFQFTMPLKFEKGIARERLGDGIKKLLADKRFPLSKKANIHITGDDLNSKPIKWELNDQGKTYIIRKSKKHKNLRFYIGILMALRKTFQKHKISLSSGASIEPIETVDKKTREKQVLSWKLQDRGEIYFIKKTKKGLRVDILKFRKEYAIKVAFRAVLVQEPVTKIEQNGKEAVKKQVTGWWINYDETWSNGLKPAYNRTARSRQ